MRILERWRRLVLTAVAGGFGVASLVNVSSAQSAATRAPTISLGDLPATWTVAKNVMDPIWKPIKETGVNYYAFGGPVSPARFAARSDPSSQLYQAWLGGYVVKGGLTAATANDSGALMAQVKELTQRDQRAWLGAMGDPAPVAEIVGDMKRSEIVIDGATRPLYTVDMKSHSDLSDGSMPLAMSLGMPPAASYDDKVAPYHDVILHAQAAIWYDAKRGVTIVIYSASSRFTDKTGVVHDNGPSLDSWFRTAMQHVRVED